MKVRLPSRINLKIISATSVVLFTLLTVFVGTYTWFQSVKGDDHTGDMFKVEKTEGSVTGYTIHEFYGVTTDNSTWGFNPTPTVTVDFSQGASQSTPLIMGEYSLDNPDHPALILFSVEGSFETIIAKTSSEYLASAQATIQASNNPLSSVIESQSLTFAVDPKVNGNVTGNLVNELGNTVSRTYMPIIKNQLSEKKSFVKFNGNAVDYKKEAKLFEGDITDKTFVGLIINYNSESLNYISSYYLGNSYLIEGLGFSCDWSLEV